MGFCEPARIDFENNGGFETYSSSNPENPEDAGPVPYDPDRCQVKVISRHGRGLNLFYYPGFEPFDEE